MFSITECFRALEKQQRVQNWRITIKRKTGNRV